jgi:hypothetical protein
MNVSANSPKIATALRSAPLASAGRSTRQENAVATESAADPQESRSLSVPRDQDPTRRFREAAEHFLIGSIPGVGCLANMATSYGCAFANCSVVKEELSALGSLTNLAGSVALGTAAVFGGGPVFGAVTGVLLGTSALALAFANDYGG